MSDLKSPREKLVRISRLVASGDFEQAQELLDGVLAESPENADAWYLAAVLAKSNQDKVEALNRALEIDPNHSRAQELLARLGSKSRAKVSAPPPEVKEEIPQSASGSSRFALFGVLGALVVIIIMVGVVFGSRLVQTPTATPTIPAAVISPPANSSQTSNVKPSAGPGSPTVNALPGTTLPPPTARVSNTPTLTPTITLTPTPTHTLTPSSTFPPVSAPPPLTVPPPPVSATPGQPNGPILETPAITVPPPPVTPE